MFTKILIANRGEIAVRIIRACREMGILTVTVFSEADRDSMHVSLADEAYCIGPPQIKDSYLNMSAIITVAAATGAQAIHPGYGLLAENAKFAALCEQCGIVFIGPRSQTIKELGDKNAARGIMVKAGVPVVPGWDLIHDLTDAEKAAKKLGYPLLIKARAGGGGRGIRLVSSPSELEKSFLSACAEAKSAFGDGSVYMEKFLSPVKHIEMQMLCDTEGNAVCLGERECSIQRKSQKLIEESPSPSISQTLREQMQEAAIKAVKAVNYTGVGTVEFLLDQDKNFYFIEMNTRLQVEHPVTEMVTDVDLVKWQIRVAAGVPLAGFDNYAIKGHAIECRINAENPFAGFRASSGRITNLHIPGGAFVRFDTAIYQNCVISPYYDSMIGKLIVYAGTREEAIRKMRTALCELIIEGVDHNIELHLEILSDPLFVSGDYTTDFIEKSDILRKKVKVGELC
ncbi:MAG: acetyl-CoA carboxylase biotin carboxylase subunit [Clostridiales bacterium]|nr:acetyl-CoA carboxylase biotin carboxylase subunit [Clostridiales bacterium]